MVLNVLKPKMEFSVKEIQVLDKIFDKAKWSDDGQFIFYGTSTEDRHAFFGCYDESYVEDYVYEEVKKDDEATDTVFWVALEDMLEDIDDALCDFVECYCLTEQEISVYDNMMKRCGIYEEGDTCADR